MIVFLSILILFFLLSFPQRSVIFDILNERFATFNNIVTTVSFASFGEWRDRQFDAYRISGSCESKFAFRMIDFILAVEGSGIPLTADEREFLLAVQPTVTMQNRLVVQYGAAVQPAQVAAVAAAAMGIVAPAI